MKKIYSEFELYSDFIIVDGFVVGVIGYYYLFSTTPHLLVNSRPKDQC